MNIVLGIDTGGTYTDGVLYDHQDRTLLKKAKFPTFGANLSQSILGCIDALDTKSFPKISKVVLSTTLATNAIVEDKGRPTGLIVVGEPPKGEIPPCFYGRVQGRVNIKGVETIPLNEDEIYDLVKQIPDDVEAIAVCGMMSVRNACQELRVKEIIQSQRHLPVICSHELSTQLGFHARTVTAILNASLIPIIEDFVHSVEISLKQLDINAPIFMVKGDGALANLDFIRQKPIESILSGPASSMIGALGLANVENGVVVDMGGTTLDFALVENSTLTLSPIGAKVGDWQTHIDSANIRTFGLGGDTQILVENGHPKLTRYRILPACRGGQDGLTPTDLLHLIGEMQVWDTDLARATLHNLVGEDQGTNFINESVQLILDTMYQSVLEPFMQHKIESNGDTHLPPIIAIGAPAQAWFLKLQKRYPGEIVIPKHFEVANGVGAAMASVEERVSALVRPDEANDGFVVHIEGDWKSFSDKEEAVDYGYKIAKQKSIDRAQTQGFDQGLTTQVFVDELVENLGWKKRYIETQIKAVTKLSRLKLK